MTLLSWHYFPWLGIFCCIVIVVVVVVMLALVVLNKIFLVKYQLALVKYQC